ncbi:MAG: hypothetical protein HY677_06050, partial [Chloroflexi bacterium]|nr:hypothetical protein [Chloroflexota bacterium]
GTGVIEINEMERIGDRLRMKGILMGQFQTQVYVGPGDFFRMFKLLLFSSSALRFAILSPFLWVKHYRREYPESSSAGLILPLSLAIILVFVLTFLLAMAILGIISLAS